MATIAVDIRSLQNSQLTGVGIYAKEVILDLLKNDPQNKYKLFYSGFRPINEDFLNGLKQFSNFKLIKINWPNKLLNFCLWLFNFPKFDIYIKADLFWFPHFNFWSLNKKIPYVVSVHDLAFKRYPQFYSAKMKFWHNALRPKQKLHQAAQIIAVSENTKKDIEKLIKIHQDKIRVVYSGLANENLKNAEAIKQKYKLPDKFLLYLGTIEPRKNIIAVIKAFEKIKDEDCYLVIAGGKGWLYQKTEKRILHSFKKNKIKLINYIAPEDAPTIYALAQALVWPSFYEGFGLPPLEAQKQKTNVIASANSSLPEVLKNSALLIDPYNSAEIGACLNQLLNDKNLRNNLILKSKKNSNNYSWEKTAQQMIALFNQLT